MNILQEKMFLYQTLKNVSNIKKGDLLILFNEEEPAVENLVIMANSDVVDDYVMGFRSHLMRA